MGAIEEKWDRDVGTNWRHRRDRDGISGGTLSLAVLVLGAVLFTRPARRSQHYQQLPQLVTPLLGRPGFCLVTSHRWSIACLGATLLEDHVGSWPLRGRAGIRVELGRESEAEGRRAFQPGLQRSHRRCRGAGTRRCRPAEEDWTEVSMALTAASLPVGVLPFLILMNDKRLSLAGTRTALPATPLSSPSVFSH